MLFSLDVLRARKGDCLMVHHGDATDPHLILIDGGPRQVYGPHLKPRLLQLRSARGLKPHQPLIVDMLMVSHVDDDHIQGLLDLTRDLITAQDSHRPPLVQVLSFWHNSFENIIGHRPDELTASFKRQFGPASMSGDPPADLSVSSSAIGRDEETVVSTLKILASIEQGAQLRNDANRLQFPLNPEFDGQLIMARKANESLEVLDDLRMTIAGPRLLELKMLHAKHQAWLKELQKQGKTPEEVLSAYVDKSVPNLSSIVALAEADGASMLLTGDARGDKILQGLEFTGRLKKGRKLRVDLLKVPHHGSANNLANDFFQRIVADHYVFSGNGEHGNPERESLEMLLAARGGDAFTVHLTYPIDVTDQARKADWEKERLKEKQRKQKNPNQPVRPAWSPKQHSLAEFLKQQKDFARKIKIVEEGKPHVIDLRDAVKF